ncbi:MAG: hypothetical protein RBS46_17055 [Methyloversatilis sp.]|jgi:hypothetical protein|nr:hypothetical protein [Methyloversatilis sp.]
MSESKYGKYILTELKTKVEAPWAPVFNPEEIKRVLFLDSDVVDGAFYVECAYFLPGMVIGDKYQENAVRPHKHVYDEVLAVFGTDIENPQDLGGELEFWLDDEKHIISKSCIVFIPKGLTHGPIKWNRIDRPVFHFAVGTAAKYFDEVDQ